MIVLYTRIYNSVGHYMHTALSLLYLTQHDDQQRSDAHNPTQSVRLGQTSIHTYSKAAPAAFSYLRAPKPHT